MAAGGLRAPPYRAVIELITKLDDDWREFDGWALAHGIDFLNLSLVRALNVLQHWYSIDLEPKDMHKMEAMMRGPLETTIPPRKPDPNARRLPPRPWWFGNDEQASAASFRAAQELRR